MTTNYHTPLVNGQPANASTFNSPLSELDSAITGIFSGTTPFDELEVDGDIQAVNVDLFGNIGAVNGNFSGNVTGVDGTFSGNVSGVNGTFSGNISAVDGNFSDDITANDGTFSGNISAVDGAFSGSISGVNGTFSGNISAVDGNFSDDITANDGVFSGDVSATNGVFSGNLSAVGSLTVGSFGLTKFNVSTSTTLLISSGQITITRTRHLVDTETSASWDDLDTINGGAAGDVLVLQSVTSARVVVIKHNTGNIFLNGMDVVLDNPRKALTLMYDGTQWVLIGDPPNQIDRRCARALFFDGTAISDALPMIEVGTPTAALEAESSYTLYTSTATAGGIAGVTGNTNNQFQLRHNPSLTVWLKTGSSVADIRWYLGFRSGAIYGAGDNLPSTSEKAVVFRYSTVAGDTGFRPVTCDGTTQTVGTAIGTVTANTIYKLQVTIFNGVAYFSVNNSAPTVVTATIPTSTQSLGWMAHLQSQAASAKTVLMRQVVLEVN